MKQILVFLQKRFWFKQKNNNTARDVEIIAHKFRPFELAKVLPFRDAMRLAERIFLHDFFYDPWRHYLLFHPRNSLRAFEHELPVIRNGIDQILAVDHYTFEYVMYFTVNMSRKSTKKIEKSAIEYFKNRGGIVSYKEAVQAGIHPRVLRFLVSKGEIEKLERGLYILPGLLGQTYPDLALIEKRIPNGTLFLISALYFHGLTTEIPHYVYLALKKGYKPPQINYPPVKFHWLSPKIFELGIEAHEINGVTLKCYSKEKTIVDCFRFRNEIGIDTAIEALKKYYRQGSPKWELIEKYAGICRVKKIITPYIEAILNES